MVSTSGVVFLLLLLSSFSFPQTYNSAISCEQCVDSEDDSSIGLRPDTDLSSDEDELEEELVAAAAEKAAGRRKSDLEWDNDSLPAFTHPPTRDPVKV